MEVHHRKNGKETEVCLAWLGSSDDSAVVFLSHLLFCVCMWEGGWMVVCVCVRACVYALNQFQDGKIKDTADPLMSFSKTISVKHQTK